MARRIARFATPDTVPTPDATNASPAPPTSRPRRNTNGSASAVQARRMPPTAEQIAARAYEIYLARGGEHGYHDEDWFQAEQELRQTDPSITLPTAPGLQGRDDDR